MNKAKLHKMAEELRRGGADRTVGETVRGGDAAGIAQDAPEIAQNAARIAQDAPEDAGRAVEHPAPEGAPGRVPARLRKEWTIGEMGCDVSLGRLYLELIGAADFERTQRSAGEVCRVAYARAKVALRVWRDMQEREDR